VGGFLSLAVGIAQALDRVDERGSGHNNPLSVISAVRFGCGELYHIRSARCKMKNVKRIWM
ncbi:MAG TPA: hypothetical protein VGJ87_16055, partial [Roseiflexaceae bacterium]